MKSHSGQPKRVLFVCLGNSCRSQMAEALARAYGSDVLTVASAGIWPAQSVARDTIRAMQEKDIDLGSHYPKKFGVVSPRSFDLIVNMSGLDLPEVQDADAPMPPVTNWDVQDPIGFPLDVHCRIRDHIETLVMQLILELRKKKAARVR